MGKTNKKKKHVADKVRSRRLHEKPKKANPFELRINKQKQHVIGRRTATGEKGVPGLSRSRAVEKRSQTLLVEYQARNKTNQFTDKRIGEYDPNMTLEEKMLQRTTKERMKSSKVSLFNLNDEEELTHYGKSLSEIEKFDSEPSDSDDGREGNISGKAVSEELFGGMFHKKQDSRSRQEWMEDVIAKSKMKKHEKHVTKEKTMGELEKLDESWKTLAPLMAQKATKEEEKSNPDDYDFMVRTLQFEQRAARGSERLKKPEEIAKDEKEKLEKLENDRIRRMKGLTEEEDGAQVDKSHTSVDALDDDFAKLSKKRKHKDESEEEEGDDGDNEEEEEEEEEDDDDDDDDEEGSEEEEGSDEQEEEEEGMVQDDEEERSQEESTEHGELQAEENEEEDDEDESEDEGDSFSDIDSAESESDQEELGARDGDATEIVVEERIRAIRGDLEKRKEMMDTARSELPFVFGVPKSVEEFQSWIADRNYVDQLAIIERIRKCNHPSLGEGNKDKLKSFLGILLRHFLSLCQNDDPEVRCLFDGLTKQIYEMTQMFPATSSQHFADILCEFRQGFEQLRERRKGKGKFPSIDLILFLKLISQVFPASDFRHSVTTRAMLLLGHILFQGHVAISKDLYSGLICCNLFLEYVSYSKRFVPEAINFLRNALAHATKTEEEFQVYSQIKSQKPLLVIESNNVEDDCKVTLQEIFFSPESKLQATKYRCWALKLTVWLLKKFIHLYHQHDSFDAIFKPFIGILKCLDQSNFGDKLKTEIAGVIHEIESHKTKLNYLCFEKLTSTIQFFEPKFEETFEERRRHGKSSKTHAETKRLQHNYKREFKSAVREVRRDNQFLANHQLKEKAEKDAERKKKVKDLMSMLSNQEGDFRKTKKGKF